MAEFVMNNAKTASIGETPLILDYGERLNLPHTQDIAGYQHTSEAITTHVEDQAPVVKWYISQS